jgi:hypothetical protein
MFFEARLRVGKAFHIGLGWSETVGLGGAAEFLTVPAFCRDPDCAEAFAPSCTANATAHWTLWRMSHPVTRREFIESPRRCNPVHITEQTSGAAFVSLDFRRQASIDICLSTEARPETPFSVFDDWQRAMETATEDEDLVLRLTLPPHLLRDFDLEGFKTGKLLGCTDVGFVVRRRPPADALFLTIA